MAVTWSDQPQMDELWDKAISAISWLFHRCGCLAAGPWSRLSNLEVQSWSSKSAHSNLLWMQIWSESNVWLILNRIFHWTFVFVRIHQLELTQQIPQFHWNSQFPFKNFEMESSGKSQRIWVLLVECLAVVLFTSFTSREPRRSFAFWLWGILQPPLLITAGTESIRGSDEKEESY